MNIFVTGGTGFVGSHLVEKLVSSGHNVYCLVRNPDKLRYLEGKPVELIAQSELEYSIFHNMDLVIHVAGVTKANSREEYVSSNVEMTRNLCRMLINANFQKKVIIISSQTAVGPSLDEKPVKVGDEPKPRTWYGESKLAMEKLIMDEADALDWIILRPPVVFGPGDTDMLESFRLAKKGLNPLLNGKDKLISIVYVKDLADGIIQTFNSGKSVKHKVFFVGNDAPVSVTYMNKLVSDHFKVKLRNIYIPVAVLRFIGYVFDIINKWSERPNIISRQKVKELLPQYWVCDTQKFNNELEFAPKYEIDTAVLETIKWYEDKQWL